MKRRIAKNIFLLSLICLIGLIFNLLFPNIEDNTMLSNVQLLQNGSFEDNLKYWNVWKDKGDYNAQIDNNIKKYGDNSIKIYNPQGKLGRGTVAQIIDASQLIGKALKLNQWIKSNNLNGTVYLRARFLDGKGKAIGDIDVKTVDIKGTVDWNQQTYKINVPNNSNIKNITIEYLYDNCTGTIWLDEITGTKADQVASNNLLQNGNFEEGQSYWSNWVGSGSYNVSTDVVTKKDGVKSLNIYNTTTTASKGGINQTIDGTNLVGKAIKLTQWLKTDKLTGLIRIRTSYKDVSDNTIGNMDVKTIDISGTVDWNQQTYTINVPNNSNIKKITIEYLYDNCTGKLWIDGVTGTKVNQLASNNFLQNGNFEEGQSYWSNWAGSGSYNVSTDTVIKKDGAKSLKMYNMTSKPARGILSQTINLPK